MLNNQLLINSQSSEKYGKTVKIVQYTKQKNQVMSKETGLRLKQVRQTAKLSQRQLARKTGVANATISQIESGTLNPTVGMLKKVLDGIPISLSEFFASEAGPEERIFFGAADLTHISEGNVSYRQVGQGDNAIQLLHEHYKPGASTGKHALTHEGEECGIVLKGSLEVTVGDQRKVLKPGDAYYFKSNQPHQFRNVGAKTCEVISACTPPSF